ncbi:hypothetical protein [Haloplasma contractile]|uniref:Uncharacterized protein n=1 Tax=Haloplasma contractile SSD-17B TaxID=1033810 RepID=U2E804_9MOLU|nr:hypothetical protein [Haloplasma contractile]ERJ11328.1 hypothetical protein HLPCO_002630 [Haloplasma contractile SSD-17B]
MNGDINNNQGNQPSLYAISPESIQPQPVGSLYPPYLPGFPSYPDYPQYPISPIPPVTPNPPYPIPPYQPFPRPPYQPNPPYPQFPEYPYQPQPYPQYPPQTPQYPQYPVYPPTIGGCNQKWATIRTRDGRRLYIYVTSIAEDSVGGFLSNGRQIALDYDEIVEMTC